MGVAVSGFCGKMICRFYGFRGVRHYAPFRLLHNEQKCANHSSADTDDRIVTTTTERSILLFSNSIACK